MSSSTDHQWIYDVFISFSGEDTRKNFVSHLYAALKNSGVNTFFDDEELRKGKQLGPELERAIEGSQISIVVLSPNYAGSSWCLNELVHIMECYKTHGQLVLPLFYYVDPSSVRHQTAEFGKLLKVTAKKNEALMSKWRKALYDVGSIAGCDAKNARTDGDLVKIFVDFILIKLDVSLLHITEFPVGLEPRVQKITKFIDDQSNKVCTIGIWGMGGSGKTTTAKAIYNQIHRRFEGRTSFIENIREVCDNNSTGVINLQEQLLSDLLKIQQKIHSIASGITKIWTRLKGQKAFVVLDDVTTSEQLKKLCADPKLFGSGSVLIITTRDVSLLNSLSGDHIFTMTEMDEYQSLELFCWHAFQQSNPREGFSELTKKVVGYCGGLPLALEVLGRYLSKRKEQEWTSAISKLAKIPNYQVQQKLRISYDGLKDHMEKDIFLDICCFFIGKNRADVTEILNGCGLYADIGIAVLIERSLVKVEKNNKLGMHDLLRDMGRAIVGESSVKEPANHSRLWFHDDVNDVLLKKTGTEIVEGLIFKLPRTHRTRFATNAFQEMKKLRLLKLDGVVLFGDYSLISKELKWVNLQRSTFNFIPNDFDLGNLVVFELKYSNVKHVWQETKLLEKLKILNLSHSKYLKSTPDFSKLPNLEKLIMKDCPSLSEVHSSIGDLRNLLLINLSDCTSLANFPREIYQLISVKTLIVSGCSKIEELEEDVLQMESLTTLIAANTGIKQVPYSIARLKSIGYISLCGYKGLSRDVFPSLILSWISPTKNSLPRVCPFEGNSLSLISLDVVESDNMGYQSPMLTALSKLRCVWVQCHSENQLSQELRRFIGDLYDVNFTELETTSHGHQSTNLSLKSIFIGMGSSKIVMDTLGKSLAQGLSTNDSSVSFLPGDNYPSRLAYTCEGPSVCFQVPEDSDFCMKGITLRVLYTSKLEYLATDCLISVLIINYTKFTIQIYNRDTVMSFNNEDWQGVISNLGVGDNVEIFVALGHGLTVKETVVYLLYDESIDMEIEPSITVEVEPSTDVKMEPIPEVEVQPSPHTKAEPSPELEAQTPLDVKIEPSITVEVEPSTDAKKEPLHEVEVQPSSNVKTDPSSGEELHLSPDVKIETSLVGKKEPLLKTNKKIITRLAKRVGECLCLNQK